MITHIHRPSRDPSPVVETYCPEEAECACCTAIRRAHEAALFDALPECCSPLTPGIQFVNLSHSHDGQSLRAALAADWVRMFSQLPAVGDGLVMTRNSSAILGRRMAYPELRMTAGGCKGASGDAGLWLDFRHLGAARAVHQRGETGHLFGVEFSDQEGEIVHRFTLTSESDLDEFLAWTRLHQACQTEDAPAWKDEPPKWQMPARSSHPCDTGTVHSIVAACGERLLPLRVTVRGGGITQRAVFIPRVLQPAGRWWFAHDDEVGLHFQTDLFSSITVEEHLYEADEKRLVLRAAGEDGTVALVLEAGSSDTEDAWHTLLKSLV